MLASDTSVKQALAGVRVSLAREPADLLLANCSLVNVWSEETYTASVAISGSRIVAIRPGYEGTAKQIIDCAGRFVLPGYVEPLLQDFDGLIETLVPMGVTSIVIDGAYQTSPSPGGAIRLRHWQLAPERLGWHGQSGNARKLHEQRTCSTIDAVAEATALGVAAIVDGDVALLRAIASTKAETARLLLRHFQTDNGSASVKPLLKAALEAGIPLHKAVQMTGFNAATQYGIEHEVGSVAPGRKADLLVLDDLSQLVPSLVIVDGRLAARNGKALWAE
jgi:adenine deaminase